MDLSRCRIGRLQAVETGERIEPENWPGAIEHRMRQLKEAGLSENQGVFLWEANSIQFFVDLFATWTLGAVAIPVDVRTPEDTRKHLETALRPRLSLRQGGRIVQNEGEPRIFSEKSGLLLLTSGSTGFAKGILHSAQALQKKVDVLAETIGVHENFKAFCALPTYFGHGLICNSLFPLLQGRPLYIANGFGLDMIGRLDRVIDENQITFFSTTPVVWSLIEKGASFRAKPSLQRVHCASAPLDARKAEVMRRWAGSATCWNVYGLTETTGWLSGVQLNDAEEDGDVGSPWQSEFRIDDRGEVWVRAPYQAVAIFGDGSGDMTSDHPIRADDWIRTGDIGRWSTSAHLILGGRVDFMINKGGLKIQPEEVEFQAGRHEQVRESCCFAVTDAVWGERVALAVVVNDPSQFDVEEFRKWLSNGLVRYKVPDLIKTVAELPKTSRGKLDRRAVRSLI